MSLRATARSPWFASAIVAALGVAAFILLPTQLGLLARIAIMALFVVSLDLVVGYAGLPTLGHVAMYGVGAYAAGIAALQWSADPLLGLAVGIGAGAATAALSGLFLLRYQGFTFLMLTIAVAQILYNLASKFRGLTGGDDGLAGYLMQPLFGAFAFDFQGRTAFAYALGALVVGLYVARRIVDSPFGLSVQGIHQSRARMAALGTPVLRQLWVLYAVAGAFAGAAGALAAQTNGIVGLDSLSFALSAEALVMLVLGGSGRLIGAVAGAAIFMTLHHTASAINPYHWLFVIGGLLMLVVLVPPARLFAALRARLPAYARPAREDAS